MSSKEAPQAFVALLDVLGFSRLVQTQSLDDMTRLLATLKGGPDDKELRSLQFSDTILLHTTGTTPQHFRRIVHEAACLIGENASRGVGLRCGIAKGEFSGKGGIYVGRAIVRAYELEQQQDWIGGILDPVLVDEPELGNEIKSLSQEGLLLPFEAPIKGGPVGPLHCLGWPIVYHTEKFQATPGSSSNWDAMRKNANAGRFFSAWHDAWRTLRKNVT